MHSDISSICTVPHDIGHFTSRNVNMDDPIRVLRSLRGKTYPRPQYQDRGILQDYVLWRLINGHPFQGKASSGLNSLPNSCKYSGYCSMHFVVNISLGFILFYPLIFHSTVILLLCVLIRYLTFIIFFSEAGNSKPWTQGRHRNGGRRRKYEMNCVKLKRPLL